MMQHQLIFSHRRTLLKANAAPATVSINLKQITFKTWPHCPEYTLFLCGLGFVVMVREQFTDAQ